MSAPLSDNFDTGSMAFCTLSPEYPVSSPRRISLHRQQIQGVPKKITRFGNRAKQDLELSKWHNNTSVDALDN